jgi:hypothetical protein
MKRCRGRLTAVSENGKKFKSPILIHIKMIVKK